jgi:hypothetical protein
LNILLQVCFEFRGTFFPFKLFWILSGSPFKRFRAKPQRETAKQISSYSAFAFLFASLRETKKRIIKITQLINKRLQIKKISFKGNLLRNRKENNP